MEGSIPKFITEALKIAQRYITSQLRPNNFNLNIVISADNDFYSSQSGGKTGLGSSAALTVSLIGALLIHYLPDFSFSNQEDLRTLEILSHLSHFHAQGKVGSGFDISCAVYGSQTYRTFTKSIFEGLDKFNSINNIISLNWDQEHEKFGLHPALSILMGDVHSGSNTPKMVGAVMTWMENNMEAKRLWQDVNYENTILLKLFVELLDLNDSYTVMNELSKIPAIQWKSLSKCHECLINIYKSGMKSNHILSKITEMSKIPIIPTYSLKLINKTLLLPGVLMAGIPGAGGFDAIYCICLSASARTNVIQQWKSRMDNIRPLNCVSSDDSVKVHDVDFEFE